MAPLENLIRNIITRDGPITVEQFMDLALAHPEHGYYHARNAIGRSGDFTTAPEISQMFGEMLGLWAGVVWQQMGAPDRVQVIEIGPGRGTLMVDMLRATRSVPGFAEALEIQLVETSARLRAAQRAALPDDTVHWHDDLDSVPDGPAIIVANEFLDALPVQQIVRMADATWHERQVALDSNGQLIFAVADSPATQPPNFDAPPGTIFERSARRAEATTSIATKLLSETGAALVIDYGHTQSAPGDTLQAVRDHLPHPVLADPGLADLTSHVDFEAISSVCESAGARPHGPLTQGRFLSRIGIESRAGLLMKNASSGAAHDIESALHRLIDSGTMGALFKVIAMTPPGAPIPPGFETMAGAGKTT